MIRYIYIKKTHVNKCRFFFKMYRTYDRPDISQELQKSMPLRVIYHFNDHEFSANKFNFSRIPPVKSILQEGRTFSRLWRDFMRSFFVLFVCFFFAGVFYFIFCLRLNIFYVLFCGIRMLLFFLRVFFLNTFLRSDA